MNGRNYMLNVNACSVDVLKQTDKYLKRAGYTYLKKGLSLSQWLHCPSGVCCVEWQSDYSEQLIVHIEMVVK